MIDDNRLTREYPDLQAGLRDPLTRRVVDDLDRAYTRIPPANLRNDLNEAVTERAAEFEHAWPAGPLNSVRGQATRRFMGRRVSLMIYIVAFALVAGAADMLFAPRFVPHRQSPDSTALRPTQTIPDGGATWPTLLAHEGTPIGASFSMCGYTIAIDRAYADANDVLVEYSATAPKGLLVSGVDTSLSLQDAHGQPFPLSSGSSGPNGHGGFTAIQSFNAGGINGTPAAVSLNLSIDWIQTFARGGTSTPATKPCVQDGPAGTDPDRLPSITSENVQGVGPQTNYTIRPPKLNSPAHVEFSVPFSPLSRTATLHKAIQVGTVQLEISKVVVTPAETRFYLSADIDNIEKIGQIGFRVGGQSYTIGGTILDGTGVAAGYIYHRVNLYGAQGAWSLIFPPRQPGGSAQVIHFTLPAPDRIEPPLPTASPHATSIATPTPTLPTGNNRVMVGTSLKMTHSVTSIAPNVSQVFCKANVSHVPKGTILTVRFQKAPYHADYYTHLFSLGAVLPDTYIFGPLSVGQWRCKVDMPGGTLGSAYFRVQ